VTAVQRKSVAIDWDDLETALTWRDPEGGRHFLDLLTGEVVLWTRDGNTPSSEAIDEGLADGRLVPIDPLPPSVEYGWMEGGWRSSRPQCATPACGAGLMWP